jgi:hypothetical protein
LGANFARGRENILAQIGDFGTAWRSTQDVMKKLFEQDPPLFSVAIVSGLQHDDRPLYRLIASFTDLNEKEKEQVIASKINNKNFISYLMEFFPKTERKLSHKQSAVYNSIEPLIDNTENDVASLTKDINSISYSPYFEKIFSGVLKWKNPLSITTFLGVLTEKEFFKGINLSDFLFKNYKSFTEKYLDAFTGQLSANLKKLYKK